MSYLQHYRVLSNGENVCVQAHVCASVFVSLREKRKKKDTEKDRSDSKWTDSGRAEMED